MFGCFEMVGRGFWREWAGRRWFGHDRVYDGLFLGLGFVQCGICGLGITALEHGICSRQWNDGGGLDFSLAIIIAERIPSYGGQSH